MLKALIPLEDLFAAIVFLFQTHCQEPINSKQQSALEKSVLMRCSARILQCCIIRTQIVCGLQCDMADKYSNIQLYTENNNADNVRYVSYVSLVKIKQENSSLTQRWFLGIQQSRLVFNTISCMLLLHSVIVLGIWPSY